MCTIPANDPVTVSTTVCPLVEECLELVIEGFPFEILAQLLLNRLVVLIIIGTVLTVSDTFNVV